MAKSPERKTVDARTRRRTWRDQANACKPTYLNAPRSELASPGEGSAARWSRGQLKDLARDVLSVFLHGAYGEGPPREHLSEARCRIARGGRRGRDSTRIRVK